MEVWKDIKGYEGRYQISPYGEIKSLERTFTRSNGKIQKCKECILLSRKLKNGELLIRLFKNGVKKSFLVKNLVAQHYISSFDLSLQEVKHSDGNKENNFYKNLFIVNRMKKNTHNTNSSIRRWSKQEVNELFNYVNNSYKTDEEISIIMKRNIGSIRRAILYYKIVKINRYIKKEIQYNIDESTGCWNCDSHSKSQGYPRLKRYKKNILVVKYFYEQKYGKVPKGKLLCHTCDNPRCVNPDHVYVGTAQDNMNDRKERDPNFGHKLKKHDVIIILERIKLGHSNISIAQDYNVNQSVISDIKLNKIWKHIKR